MFLDLSAETMQRQLVLELTRIFDKDMSCGNKNCSLMMLKASCISNQKYFPNGEKDEYVLKIDKLCKTFKTIIPKEIRNKQIAHLDLQTLYSGKPSFVIFSDLYELVEETQSVLESICERFLGINAKLQSVAELKEKYVQEKLAKDMCKLK